MCYYSNMKKTPNFSWMNPDLEVRNIKGFGKGIFAKKDFKKDTILTIFGGYVMTRLEEEKLKAPFNDYAHQIAPSFVIGIRKRGELQPVDFYNHSCNPNAGFKGQIFLVAMRNIKKEEQVTFDYGMVLMKTPGLKIQYKLKKCMCGSKNCRQTITVNDWKIPDLQKRYNGYFQWYIQSKVDKINRSSKLYLG